MFEQHHQMAPPRHLSRRFAESRRLKIALWNAFVDSDLLGINDDDCSVIPNILPASYLPIVERACADLMTFLFRLLALPDRELLAILTPTPVTDYLIRELRLLRHRPRRMVGSLRFDLAIVGEPEPDNPPKLFEVNEIGFDGAGRSSFIQETILALVPGLADEVICLDTAANEGRNMRRLGRSFARLQYGAYNWEEEMILSKAREQGVTIRMSTPTAFGVDVDEECVLLSNERVALERGRLRVGRSRPDAFQLSYSFELGDYQEAPGLFRDLVRTRTPQYSPFFTALIAPKTILTVLADRALRQKLVGARASERLARSILPAFSLAGAREQVLRRRRGLVIKHADGMGGERDFIGDEIRRALPKIRASEERHWIAQERVRMNTIRVDGFLSRPRRVICDLGAFMHYDWRGDRFAHLAVGGFITRATNHSLKVNVSGGGIQVPVMFARRG